MAICEDASTHIKAAVAERETPVYSYTVITVNRNIIEVIHGAYNSSSVLVTADSVSLATGEPLPSVPRLKRIPNFSLGCQILRYL